MARPTKLTEKEKTQIRNLRDQTSLPYAAIAARFGVSERTIIRICNPEAYERQKEVNRKYQAEKGAQIRAQRAENSKRYQVIFHTVHDAPVVERLNKEKNVQDYIRQLVLRDIKSEEPSNETNEQD